MSSELQAAILGTGSYVPARRLTNQDFEKTLETTDEWITTRTGIRARRIAAPDEATSDLCARAASAAIEDAGIAPADLDLILVSTLTPDYMMPSTACVLQKKLGLSGRAIPAFDLNAACSGYVYGLATAKAYVEAGLAKHVLVVGAEVLSRVLNYQDRSTCILFGDGAGATVVGRHTPGGRSHRIREVNLWADGRDTESLLIPAGGSVHPASHTTVDEKLHCVKVNGKEVFRFAVSKMLGMVKDTIERNGWTAEQIGRIIPHQANYRILESACERLNLPMDLFFTNLAEYGNTSAASVPLALDEAARAGKLPAGKPVILVAFGAGMTWACAVLEW
ncbi:MAG: ketoacyl-ACP synthase III [Planctomycetota bacterium]|nr:ketoacyl-ACP synthase III [Planctomycetota bacterium]